MKITKGQKLIIKHDRKGKFNAVAKKDFDTEKEEWYPVVVGVDFVEGMASNWIEGEDISCRASFVSDIKTVN